MTLVKGSVLASLVLAAHPSSLRNAATAHPVRRASPREIVTMTHRTWFVQVERVQNPFASFLPTSAKPSVSHTRLSGATSNEESFADVPYTYHPLASGHNAAGLKAARIYHEWWRTVLILSKFRLHLSSHKAPSHFLVFHVRKRESSDVLSWPFQ